MTHRFTPHLLKSPHEGHEGGTTMKEATRWCNTPLNPTVTIKHPALLCCHTSMTRVPGCWWPSCCPSGSGSGAIDQKRLRQAEERRVSEGGPAGSQPLQPAVPRPHHLPGTHSFTPSETGSELQGIRQEGRRTQRGQRKSLHRFNHHSRGDRRTLTRLQSVLSWMSACFCFRRHFCTSGRRRPAPWQPFTRASRAVSIMSSPPWRSEVRGHLDLNWSQFKLWRLHATQTYNYWLYSEYYSFTWAAKGIFVIQPTFY